MKKKKTPKDQHLLESYFKQMGNLVFSHSILQKQPTRGVLKKRCSENMQQIYRSTPMPNCDFNKVAIQEEKWFLGWVGDGGGGNTKKILKKTIFAYFLRVSLKYCLYKKTIDVAPMIARGFPERRLWCTTFHQLSKLKNKLRKCFLLRVY